MAGSEFKFYVFLGSGDHPDFMGTLYAVNVGTRESFSFAFHPEFLDNHRIFLDPDLAPDSGRQYLNGKKLFGIFSDSCPDRWGRTLLKKKELLRARAATEKPRTLTEKDFLVGIADKLRLGALRLKLDPEGQFVASEDSLAVPPWVRLRELEDAALHVEKDDDLKDENWLSRILEPGSSLGGARPKANVLATDGTLWIAKFPSRHDDFDVGAWEMVAHDLAKLCGLNVPEACWRRFSDRGATFLVKRFDRECSERIHFASAMTMLGKEDGDDAAYPDILDFLTAYGTDPVGDSQELWKRMVFNMLISNTDDHLRNHGFLLTRQGWRLSPLYDVNPTPFGRELSLSTDYENHEISADAAVEVAELFGVSKSVAGQNLADMATIISENWKKLAAACKISGKEAEKMSGAFALAEECRNGA